MDKDRTDYSRATTPVAESPIRLLDELMQNGQTTATPDGTQRFVNRKSGVESKSYYHGLLPREDIISMLDKDGDFLVRTTSISQDEPRKEVVRHFILQPMANKMYTLDLANRNPPVFPTIEELIDHYIVKGETFSQHNIRLITPITRQDWEFYHHQLELGDKLGEGAFGEVYSGYLNRNKKRTAVAIKTLKCTHVTKDKIEESMKEARLLRQCRHANVVRCYGVAAEDEPLMVVMELVKGGSLDSFLIEKGADIMVDERVHICAQAAMAIAYIHSRGILHRDIAARNCLYGDRCLKLSDFGMSRKTKVHQLKGTERVPIRWIAPEVFQTQQYTFACDVWALGVLIWEVFNNGQEPYTGWTGAQVKHEVKVNKFRLPMPDWTPPVIADLIKKIWAESPEERITSEELANELAAARPKLLDTPTTTDQYNFLKKATDTSQFGSSDMSTTPRGSRNGSSPVSSSEKESEKTKTIVLPDGSHRSYRLEKKRSRSHKRDGGQHRNRKDSYTNGQQKRHQANGLAVKSGSKHGPSARDKTHDGKATTRYNPPHKSRHSIAPSKYRDDIDVTLDDKNDRPRKPSNKSKDKKRHHHGKAKNYEALNSTRSKHRSRHSQVRQHQSPPPDGGKTGGNKLHYEKSMVAKPSKQSDESVSLSKGEEHH